MPKKAPAARLRLSQSLSLPVESITETFAILGKRGSGKSSTAVVMAEEMIRLGHPVVVVDPVGTWWGLRSSADGKDDGLPVVIFGGDHADVPLEEKAGRVIADALIDGRFPAILDLSLLSKSAMRRLMTDFLERLYQRNREALHLIVDEADLLAPQRLPAEGLRLFGAMDDIQRRGRARGLGTTLITQRPAVINKDLLSQSEVLVAMRLTGARDVAAIDEWVRLNADEDEAKIVKSSLASLPVGTAWVWSPTLLEVLERVQVRRRHTFDSSATPKPGQPRPVAEAFARIDTDALGARITELAEEAAAHDPKALQAKVARLEQQLARARRDSPTPQPEPEVREVTVEVPALTPEQEQLLARATETVREYAANACHRAEEAVAGIREQVDLLTQMLDTLPERAAPTPAPRPEQPPAAPRPSRPRATTPARTASRGSNGGSGAGLPKAQRLVLTALAQHGTLGINQVALITGYRHTSGGFKNTLSQLRTNGWIDGAGTGTATITDDGLAALGDYEPLPTGDALLAWWMARGNPVGLAERTILEVLREAYPAFVPTEEIATRSGYSATSGGFKNALSRLRSLGLAAGKGGLVLSEELVG